jgi:hypothetical protein
MRDEIFSSQVRYRFNGPEISKTVGNDFIYGGKDGGKKTKVPRKPHEMVMLYGHRFRQIPNQIKRLGAFFVSIIQSTVNVCQVVQLA